MTGPWKWQLARARAHHSLPATDMYYICFVSLGVVLTVRRAHSHNLFRLISSASHIQLWRAEIISQLLPTSSLVGSFAHSGFSLAGLAVQVNIFQHRQLCVCKCGCISVAECGASTLVCVFFCVSFAFCHRISAGPKFAHQLIPRQNRALSIMQRAHWR